MTPLPLRVLIAWVISALLACGCAKHKQTITYKDNETLRGTIPADSCAIGGVVKHRYFQLDEFAGVDYLPSEFTLDVQSDLWAPLLERAFEKRTGQKPAVTWHELHNRVPEFTVMTMLQSQTRHSLMPPEALEICRARLPEARWLLLVSIDKTMFMSDGLEEWSDQHASKRKLWMTLNVYDLRGGRSVWSSQVVYEGDGPESSSESENRLDRWDDTAAAKSYVPRNVVSNLLSAPPLRPTLDRCMEALLKPIHNNAEFDPATVDE